MAKHRVKWTEERKKRWLQARWPKKQAKDEIKGSSVSSSPIVEPILEKQIKETIG